MDIEIIKIFSLAVLSSAVAFEARQRFLKNAIPPLKRAALAATFGFGAGLVALIVASRFEHAPTWLYVVLAALYGAIMASGKSLYSQAESSNKAKQEGTR